MDRLFLDANVLFSAAYRSDARLRSLWEIPDTHLVTSRYAAEEARRNLASEAQSERLQELLAEIEVVATLTLPQERRGQVYLPEKDWPILSGAVLAEATHLITGDVRHFGDYFGQRILGVLVLTPSMYLRGRK